MYRVGRGEQPTRHLRFVEMRFFSDEFRRRMRVATAALMVALLLAVVIGVLFRMPSMLTPWLLVYVFTYASELVLWLADVCRSEAKFSFRLLWTFVWAVGYWMMVFRLRNIFVAMAAEARSTVGLSIFGG